MPADGAAQPAVSAVTCPACGGSVALRAAGYTVTVACEYCGSILDVADPRVKLITRYHEASTALEIPLGTRGVVDGVEWEAIGHLNRSIDGEYPWEEYLLFNPYHGYRWLVTDGRGWSFGEMLTATPDWAGFDGLTYDGQRYVHFFAESEARVDRVVGEFYWRVQAGERVTGADWVRPGWMLSRESNGNEVSWTLNRYMPPGTIAKAFGVPKRPDPWPPMPHQPSPWVGRLRMAWKIALVAALVLVAAMIGLSGSVSLGSSRFPIAADGREQSATLGPITLTKPYQRVDILARVPGLENGWVDLDFSLVDRATQQSYEAYGAAERYSGRDSDGDWAEGDRGKSASIASVPAGTYDLVVEYQGNRWTSASVSSFGDVTGAIGTGSASELEVEVRSGGIFFGNVIIALLALGIPLLWVVIGHTGFEATRRKQSDFAPVSDDDDDEDDE